MTRVDLTFQSCDAACAAWLYTPDTPGPHACVVMAHGFGGVRGARLDAFAERFWEAGLAALVFDYRHFGDSEGEPRQLLDVGRQVEDWRSAVAFARSLQGVDPGRVALWGTSFSGGHVVRIAAADGRVAAAISQAPFLDGLWALRAAGAPGVVRLTVAGLRDLVGQALRRPPYYMPIVAAPGTLGAMTSPDAEPGYRALFAPGQAFRNAVASRIALRIGLYRPIAKARDVACPWLVCVCDRDVVTPPQPALKAAARAPRAEVRRYDAGHFDVYVDPLFERAVADQVDFLRRHLLHAAES